MQKMKTIIKGTILFQYVHHYIWCFKRYMRVQNREYGNWQFIFRYLRNAHIFMGKNKYRKLFSSVTLEELDSKKYKHFYYSIDPFKTIKKVNRMFGNLTIDYSFILNYSLNEMLSMDTECDRREVLQALVGYSKRISKKISDSQVLNKNIFQTYFEQICVEKAKGFAEALQRILFINQCIWQCGHRLIGLGRLDALLYPFYVKDKEEGKLDDATAEMLLKEFLALLHEYYWFKGDVLSGDTGQIIVLGGSDTKGNYLYNELTVLFIKIIGDLMLPDPKILLRVNKNIPKEIIELSLNTIEKGLGEPLFANDDVIVKKLINYGYSIDDALNYVTSACWEPFIEGKSSEQNNAGSINYLLPLQKLLIKENLTLINSADELEQKYLFYLEKYVLEVLNALEKCKYQKAPILSAFIRRKNQEDISNNGAIYSDYGLTTVGLSNVVNSILNINKIVFQEQKYTLQELEKYRRKNFINNERLCLMLKDMAKWWGHDDGAALKVANQIISKANEVILDYSKVIGKGIKIGLSSPDYITAGKRCDASYDGRKKKEPLGVHISASCSIAYTELINFAASLNTERVNINGNVVDMMINPLIIKNNREKFVNFIILAIQRGFYEMQMNVVASTTLIDAKNNPAKYPDLIVRVWGFSAYYNELPEEYKDVLIKRALQNEGVA